MALQPFLIISEGLRLMNLWNTEVDLINYHRQSHCQLSSPGSTQPTAQGGHPDFVIKDIISNPAGAELAEIKTQGILYKMSFSLEITLAS